MRKTKFIKLQAFISTGFHKPKWSSLQQFQDKKYISSYFQRETRCYNVSQPKQQRKGLASRDGSAGFVFQVPIETLYAWFGSSSLQAGSISRINFQKFYWPKYFNVLEVLLFFFLCQCKPSNTNRKDTCKLWRCQCKKHVLS